MVLRTKRIIVKEPEELVIDLGLPPALRFEPQAVKRVRRVVAPSPRLYPGPPKRTARGGGGKKRPRRLPRRRKQGAGPRARRPLPLAAAAAVGRASAGHRKRVARISERLYRPPPRRAPPAPRQPPPRTPAVVWAPPAPHEPVVTASAAALTLAARKPAPAPPAPPPAPRTRVWGPRARGEPPARLPLTLPRAPCYLPRSAQLRGLGSVSGASTPPAAAPRTMAAARPDYLPDEGSDANESNDSISAPSEFLAEFLSAIMGREYVRALKYCRLILQYEPHNATARGFYSLLRQKAGESGSASASSASSDELEEDGSASYASLPLDTPSPRSSRSNSPARAPLLPAPALAGSPRHNMPSLNDSSDEWGTRASRSESSGSEWGAGAGADLNGNPRLRPASAAPEGEDVNDNAASGDHTKLIKESSSLQRLRAQFACSK